MATEASAAETPMPKSVETESAGSESADDGAPSMDFWKTDAPEEDPSPQESDGPDEGDTSGSEDESDVSPESASDEDETEEQDDEQAEPAAEDKKPEPKKSEAFARLAKQERRNRELEAKVEQLSKQLEQRGVEEVNEDNALEFLEKKNIPFQKLVDQVINGKKPKEQEDPEKAELRAQLKELVEDKKQREKREFETAKAQAKESVRGFITQNAESYELVAAKGDKALEQAWDVIEAYASSNGVWPDVGEVLASLERHYEEDAAPVLTTKKIQSKLSTITRSPPQTPGARPPAQGQKQRTLSNRATQSSPTRTPDEDVDPVRLIKWIKTS